VRVAGLQGFAPKLTYWITNGMPEATVRSRTRAFPARLIAAAAETAAMRNAARLARHSAIDPSRRTNPWNGYSALKPAASRAGSRGLGPYAAAVAIWKPASRRGRTSILDTRSPTFRRSARSLRSRAPPGAELNTKVKTARRPRHLERGMRAGASRTFFRRLSSVACAQSSRR
jgi:hypothetical protein